jgi:hypothetical protein
MDMANSITAGSEEGGQHVIDKSCQKRFTDLTKVTQLVSDSCIPTKRRRSGTEMLPGSECAFCVNSLFKVKKQGRH